MALWIPLGVVLFLFVLVIAMYNGLVAIKNHCDEAWSNIDTELKRRYDMIPNLVSTVKGYAKHERELLEDVVKLREKAAGNHGAVSSQAADETLLSKALGSLMVRLEAYPDLKASGNFLELQKELANTENRIQAALRFYNGNVRDNNNKIEQFPSNIVAGMFNFGPREFFELDIPEARNTPQVEF
ncbi:MAG: LemA family protein [Planctomycetota bacterium]|jgi:LemA protein|nr:LemA family protein [Planctomycetota bacterium]